jgi:hypothetical protein
MPTRSSVSMRPTSRVETSDKSNRRDFAILYYCHVRHFGVTAPGIVESRATSSGPPRHDRSSASRFIDLHPFMRAFRTHTVLVINITSGLSTQFRVALITWAGRCVSCRHPKSPVPKKNRTSHWYDKLSSRNSIWCGPKVVYHPRNLWSSYYRTDENNSTS